MATLRLLGFSGEIPRLVSRLLPEGYADLAFNTRLDDGGLTPIRLPRLEKSIGSPGGIKTIYKHKSEWLSWPQIVYAEPGPVDGDRLYFMGTDYPRLRVGTFNQALAVSAPNVKLTAAVTGTATSPLSITRLYAYTNVTQFGEESEPSPISNEVLWYPGQTTTLTGFQTTMESGRTPVTQRIYRSQTSSGGTTLYLIAERAASTAAFVDNISPNTFYEALPSTTWNPPPNDLTGLVSMPNGIMAAFRGKDIYFCEPFIPHAWPENYVQTVDYDIVGLGVFGSSLVVMTKGNPYILSGNSPDTMRMEKLRVNLPCINPRSIQSMGYAVMYASHDGIVTVNAGSANITSGSLFARDDWQRLNPADMVSGQFAGRYFTSYLYFDEIGTRFEGTLIFDTTGAQPFIIRTDIKPKAMFYDLTSGELFYLDDAGLIHSWDAVGKPNAMLSYTSKEFVLPRPTNFGAILVEADYILSDDQIAQIEEMRQEVIDSNQAILSSGEDLQGSINAAPINEYRINGDILRDIPTVNRTVSIGIYADDVLVAVVNKVNEMDRLPSGFLARRWKVSAASDVTVTQITLATTGAELMQV